MQRDQAAVQFGGQYIPEGTPPVIAAAVSPDRSFASGIYDSGGHVPLAADRGDIDQPGERPPEVAPDQGDTDTPRAPDEVVPDDGDSVHPGATPDEAQPPAPSIMPNPD